MANYAAEGDAEHERMTMKSIGTKLVLSALAVAALLVSPAFAKKAHPVTHETSAYTMPGYDRDGGVVAIPNPDESGK
jgi:hypothetical protein